MNLEEANKQYLDLKKKLEKTREEVEKLEVEVADLASDKAIAENQEAKARRAGNKADEDKYKKEAEEATKKLEAAKKEATTKKESLEKIQKEIDKKIEEIKEIPGMKEHFDEIMKKRSERQYFKNKEKVEKLTAEKEKYETLQKLVTEHQSLANNLKGFLTAKKQITDLEAELNGLMVDPTATPIKYNNPERAAEIKNKLLPEAKKKLKDNKEPFLKYCEKHKIEIEEKDLEELASGRIILDGKGEVDIKTTLNARVGSLNRQIKAANKAMDNYALLNKKVKEDEAREAEEAENGGGNGGEKPKWWQFIKRFKAWNERRKQAKLADEFERDEDEEEAPAGEAPAEEEHSEEEERREERSSEFRHSLKYDIVRETMEKTMKEKIAEARREMEARRAEESEREEDEERE